MSKKHKDNLDAYVVFIVMILVVIYGTFFDANAPKFSWANIMPPFAGNRYVGLSTDNWTGPYSKGSFRQDNDTLKQYIWTTNWSELSKSTGGAWATTDTTNVTDPRYWYTGHSPSTVAGYGITDPLASQSDVVGVYDNLTGKGWLTSGNTWSSTNIQSWASITFQPRGNYTTVGSTTFQLAGNYTTVGSTTFQLTGNYTTIGSTLWLTSGAAVQASGNYTTTGDPRLWTTSGIQAVGDGRWLTLGATTAVPFATQNTLGGIKGGGSYTTCGAVGANYKMVGFNDNGTILCDVDQTGSGSWTTAQIVAVTNPRYWFTNQSPTTLGGYGITDTDTIVGNNARYSSIVHNHAQFSTVVGGYVPISPIGQSHHLANTGWVTMLELTNTPGWITTGGIPPQYTTSGNNWSTSTFAITAGKLNTAHCVNCHGVRQIDDVAIDPFGGFWSTTTEQIIFWSTFSGNMADAAQSTFDLVIRGWTTSAAGGTLTYRLKWGTSGSASATIPTRITVIRASATSGSEIPDQLLCDVTKQTSGLANFNGTCFLNSSSTGVGGWATWQDNSSLGGALIVTAQWSTNQGRYWLRTGRIRKGND